MKNSVYLDLKYVNLISPKLSLFKRKSDRLFNFRCPYCGDSKRNKIKARAYVYEASAALAFKCHNCGMSLMFSTFLEQQDRTLYSQYLLDKLHTKQLENPRDERAEKRTTIGDFDRYFTSIIVLPNDHIAKQYVLKRKIPKVHWPELFYSDKLVEIDTSLPADKRLIIPFYDENKKLVAFQARALNDSQLRYVTWKEDKDTPKIYGLHRWSRNSRTFVLEGPIDSMFIANALATADANLLGIENTLGSKSFVYVFDNQPRNDEIIKHMQHCISSGRKLVIWPQHVTQKDVNDMIVDGMSAEEVRAIIDKNTHSGIAAQVMFNQWRKR